MHTSVRPGFRQQLYARRAFAASQDSGKQRVSPTQVLPRGSEQIDAPGGSGLQKRARRCRSRFQVSFSPVALSSALRSSTRTLSPPMAPLADFILTYVPLPSLPSHFTSYVNGKTPMSTPQEVFPTLVAYLVIIFGTQWFMKDRPAYKLQIPFQIHNVFLSGGSLLLMTLILEEVVPMVWNHTLFWGMCSTDMWTSVRHSRVNLCLPCSADMFFTFCSTWNFTI